MSEQAASGIDTTEVKALMRQLQGLPNDARRAVRGMLRPLGQDMLREAIWNAAAFSRRIPGALSMQIRLAGNRPGVVIRASLAKAPHSRVYEGLQEDVFRHPVFGHDRWVDQDARPYLQPAVRALLPRAHADVTAALNEIHRRAGLA